MWRMATLTLWSSVRKQRRRQRVNPKDEEREAQLSQRELDASAAIAPSRNGSRPKHVAQRGNLPRGATRGGHNGSTGHATGGDEYKTMHSETDTGPDDLSTVSEYGNCRRYGRFVPVLLRGFGRRRDAITRISDLSRDSGKLSITCYMRRDSCPLSCLEYV